MKRTLDDTGEEDPAVDAEKKTKKMKMKGELEEETGVLVHLDEDLLFEVLKHVDARSLATAACVNKQWYKTAQDERLWEMICTRHWANTGCGSQQLRSVVLALGGFRRLHSHCLWPLLKPPPPLLSSSSLLPLPLPLPSSSSSLSSSQPSSSSSTSSSSSSLPPPPPPPAAALPSTTVVPSKYWGKDEVQLSLSLLSIRYFEKMNVNSRGGGAGGGR